MRRLILPLALLVALASPAAPSHARTVATIPLPPGARPTDDGGWRSPWTWRRTLQHYQRLLPRRAARVEPVVRYRNVAYMRALPTTDTTAYRAIHILLADGATTIYILPR